VVEGATSRSLSGVPQGTVLGPLIFLLYVNDIDENLNSCIRHFDDDWYYVYKVIKSPEDHCILQQDLNSMLKWINTC